MKKYILFFVLFFVSLSFSQEQFVKNFISRLDTNKISYLASIPEPLIKTHWGDSLPYVSYFPKFAKAGSGSVAMAQFMYYYKHPLSGHGYFIYKDYLMGDVYLDLASECYDYYKMPLKLDSNSTPDEIKEVSKLIYHCAISTFTHLHPVYSHSQYRLIYQALKNNFDYDVKYYDHDYMSDSAWFAVILENIQAKRPIIVIGYDSTIFYNHIYIIDGADPSGFVHINWGMEGKYDGYYKIGKMDRYKYSESMIVGEPKKVSSVIYKDKIDDEVDVKVYPNPFNPSVNIIFNLKKLSKVKIDIVDVLGRVVFSTNKDINNTESIIWNAGNLSSGVYYCVVTIDTKIKLFKLMLMK